MSGGTADNTSAGGQTPGIFVGGLHGSGAHLLPEVLAQHPGVSEVCDGGRGEHHQTVFEPDGYYGGPGAFAFHPAARFGDEGRANAEQLRADFGALWADTAGIPVQHSPANLLRARAIAAAFPNSVQLYVHRHPVLDALATRERTGSETRPLDSLVRHWLRAHEQLARDLRTVDNCVVVSFDELRRRPDAVLADVFAAAGLEPESVDPTALRSVGRDGWPVWRAGRAVTRDPVREFEAEIRRFGYALDQPGPVGEPALEEIAAAPTPVERLRPDGYAVPDPDDDPVPEADTALRNEGGRELVCLSFGSRPSVEPYVRLAAALQERGHEVTLVSTAEHRDLARRHGVTIASPGHGVSLDLGVAPDRAEQADELFERLATFYRDHATAIIETVETAVGDADCAIVGRGVLFRGLLREHHGLDTVEARLAPLSTGDESGAAGFARARHCRRYGAVNFGVDEALGRAYEACGLDYRYTDEPLAGPETVRTLRLSAHSPRAGDGVPGLTGAVTGFWHAPADGQAAASDGGIVTEAVEMDPKHAARVDDETRAFVESGGRPVCLALPDGCERTDTLDAVLDWLAASDHRVLAVGPENVSVGGLQRVDGVDEAVFPYCRAVVHAGDRETTVACLRAGTPAVAVPSLSRPTTTDWAAWVDREGAGVHVTDPARFEAGLDAIDEGAFRRAAAVGSRLDREPGVDRAVTAIEEWLADTRGVAREETLGYIHSLPVSRRRKRRLAGLVLFAESDATAGETITHRDSYVETAETLSRERPVLERDWPRATEQLDTARHDLPHDSSTAERWSVHAHLETEDGRALSVSAVLFEQAVGGTRIGHANAGLVDVGGETRTRALLDPRAPDVLAGALADVPATNYVERALREVYETGRAPEPDRLADEPATIPRETPVYGLGDLELARCGDEYTATLAPGDGFGFDLRFRPEREPVRVTEDGVVCGGDGPTRFSYAVTRAAVSGHVVVDGERLAVEGTGWYDREFGKSAEPVGHLGGTGPRTRQGLQLDDGSELIAEWPAGESGRADIVFVDADGTRSHHRGTVEATRTWSSVRSFVEYEVAWELSVPALGLELQVEATQDDQERQTVAARPACWAGRVTAQGEHRGTRLEGTGLCEQYNQGGDRSHYRSFLRDVSREVQRSVRELVPRDPSRERLIELIASERRPGLVEGVDEAAFTESIVEPIRTLVDRGGKGWRSMCAVLCADAVGGDAQEYRPMLAIPELVHSGSLMVDDIQDESTTRRGGPTVHREFGEAQTITAGTMSYVIGYEPVFDAVGASDQQRLRAYQLHNLLLRAGHAGQGLDIHGLADHIDECIENDEFTELWTRLESVHTLKSAVPAMVAAQMGVVVAGGDREVERVVGDYFEALGLAFQIVDDAINLRGFEHGLEDHAEDLAAGKVTAPVVRAFEELDDPGRRELATLLQDPEGNVRRILDLVEGCGAVDWCHRYARELVEEAWPAVDEALPESQSKLMLRAFGWFVVDIRDY